MRPSTSRTSQAGLFLLATLLAAPAPAGALERNDPVARVVSTEFIRLNWMRSLPPPIAATLPKVIGDLPLRDRARFDSRENLWRPLPAPRLLFAGSSESVWFVHYEDAAQPPVFHLLIFEADATGHPALSTHLISDENAWSLPRLKIMLTSGAFRPLPAR